MHQMDEEYNTKGGRSKELEEAIRNEEQQSGKTECEEGEQRQDPEKAQNPDMHVKFPSNTND